MATATHVASSLWYRRNCALKGSGHTLKTKQLGPRRKSDDPLCGASVFNISELAKFAWQCQMGTIVRVGMKLARFWKMSTKPGAQGAPGACACRRRVVNGKYSLETPLFLLTA